MEHVKYGVLCRRVSILKTFAMHICICPSFRVREDSL